MLDETFIFKNKRAKSMGIELQDSISISAAEPNVTTYTIPGRNGTLYEYDGSYKNRPITAPCFLLSHVLENDIDNINAWLLGEYGYFRFEDSNDANHFMLARATNGIEKQSRVGLLNPFILKFDAKPQRFLKLGEDTVDVTSSMTIYNPTSFPSLPLLEVTGKGDIDVIISGTTLHFYGLGSALLGTNEKILYDAEIDTAYYGTNNKDSKVGISDMLFISSGHNDITIEGSGTLSSLKIIPRWWEL